MTGLRAKRLRFGVLALTIGLCTLLLPVMVQCIVGLLGGTWVGE